MSSFDNFYKKWKEENGVTTETPYQNLTNEQKAQKAVEGVDKTIERLRASRNDTSTNSIWSQIQNTANQRLYNNINKGALNSSNVIGSILKLQNTGNKGIALDNNYLNKLAEMDRAERYKQLRGLTKNNDEFGKLNLQVENIKQEKQATEEADKINKDISEGEYGSSIKHIVKGVPEEALNTMIKVAGTATSLTPDTVKLPNSRENMVEASKLLTNKYQNTTSKINNGVVKTASNLSGTIGQMVPSMLSNVVAPGSGIATAGITSGSSSYLETLNEEQDNKGKALATGVLKGLLSAGTEKITGGNIVSTGSLDDIAKKVISSKFSSNISKKIASEVYEIGGENIEEFIEDNLGNVIDKVINNKDMPDLKEWWQNSKETAKITTLSKIVLNMFGLGGNTYKEIKQQELDSNMKKMIDEAQNVIEKENISTDNLHRQLSQTEPTENNIANNQETLYNNSNESESGIDGQIQRGRMEELSGQYGARLQQEEQQQNNRQYTKQEYEQWENSIAPTEESKLTNEQIKIKNEIKRQYNKDIVFFNDDNNYNAGSSLVDKNKIYINSKQAETFGMNKIIFHEIAESNILHNREISNDIIQPAIEKIINDEQFEKQKQEFWKSESEIMPSDYAIAKDILCDRFAETKSGEKLDYDNVLSQETNMTIEYALENFSKAMDNENHVEGNIEQEKVVTRHDVIQNNREIARENIKNISTWKDKSKGISYQLETMERNIYDIVPDKAEAKRINDTYFEPIHKAEAEKQKFINKYNNRIKEYNLNKYESEAVQVLGEYKYNPDFKTAGVDIETNKTILDKVKENIRNGKVDEQKVNEAIETFRNIYDELFELENKALKENGYKEKPYRKGYFPHFIDYVPETRTEKVLNKLGFKIDKRPLPTDIAGITEQFVPGKTWNKSALERKGNKTDYNALKGFDTYIIQASDNIFHTDNIQRLRGLENEIRYQYSDKGVQERIDNILSDETLYEDEKQQLLDQILDQVNNPMPNLVTELRRYTNALANKKSEADRSVENKMGRPIYSTVNAIENRFGANAVGLNIGSALTNFIPITQAYSQVSTKNMGRAMIDTVKSYVNNDNFVEYSTFLTNRVSQAEKLYKTSLEKISDKSSILFNAIDEVTSNIVVRGKYLENIENGMNQTEAMEDADAFARKVIGDRSKGSLPTIFEEKNPITKIFTQFQLEVNNQYRYILKDIPRDLKEKGAGAIALAFFKMFAGAWLYNELSEKIIGRKPAFSPIDIAISSYKTITNEEQTTAEKVLNITTDITQDAPFIGGLVGGGRVPVNGAIPNATNLIKSGIGLATGEMDRKKALNTIGKEVSKPLYYLLPPFGGGQIKKSVEGIQTVVKGGSYGVDSKGEETLQFPVENANAGDYIKASLFGKYALPLAKDYTESGYKSLNAKDTKGYQDTKIPYKEFITYTNSNLKKKEEKIKFIEGMNISDKQKWEMYCYDIFESTEREKDKGSQLEDAKYAIANGTTKSEYIELYNSTNSRNMSMPTKEELAELKANGIELKNYMDFSIKVHDETKRQKANGNIKENGQLKNKDKISILLNGKYSEEEKKSIYSNYINKEDKKIELVNKLDFPLEEYLKYKQQEFKNDKDENDETISGTKKQKVFNYLNSIYDVDLSQEHKQIICKIENISSFDKEVANFVTNYPGLTVEEQKELLEIIGFDVDKNGKIKTTTMLPIKKYVK